MQNTRRIPIEDFFRNSDNVSFDLSPNGQMISYLAPYKSRMNIFVRKVDETKATQITFETERDIAGYIWANNSRILFTKDDGGDENFQLYGVNCDGSDLRPYTKMKGVRTYILDDLEEIDDEILIETNQRNPEIFDPYRLNLKTGEMTMLAENPGNIQSWQTDHNGKLRLAYSIVDGVDEEMLYRDSEDEEFRPVIRTNFKEQLSPIVFTADNKYVYATTNINRDKTELVLMDPSNAEIIENIFANDKYDISGIGWSNLRKKLLSVSYYAHDRAVRTFFDEEAERINTLLTKAFPNYKFSTIAKNKNEDMRIVYVGNDKTRGYYYLYNVEKDTITKIADCSPWLKEEEMSPMYPVTYQTRDGLTIEAYLTVPCQYTLETAQNLPTVVIPHGGPWARDSWGYDSEVQFLANRGYAVFQMNFRGSTGYGRKFMELSYKKWGQTMQDDITDGTMWLINKGIADKNRIAIYGGSYGGYATLQALVKTPELFACGIDYVGVSNLFTFL
ncbi:MAG: S9 family peptidase, partial [Bacteroidales bacterium]|nr:S9 family peptidase [Bacteroidales bacterium]